MVSAKHWSDITWKNICHRCQLLTLPFVNGFPLELYGPWTPFLSILPLFSYSLKIWNEVNLFLYMNCPKQIIYISFLYIDYFEHWPKHITITYLNSNTFVIMQPATYTLVSTIIFFRNVIFNMRSPSLSKHKQTTKV